MKSIAHNLKAVQIIIALAGTAFIFVLPQLLMAMALALSVLAFSLDQAAATNWLGGAVGNFTVSLFVYGLMPLVMWFIIKRYRESWRDYGVRKSPLFQAITYAAVGIMVYYITLVITLAIASGTGLVDTNQEQDIGFSRDTSGPLLILVFIGLVALPATVEELLFRGFLFTRLRKALSFVWTTVVVSVVFGVLHLQLGGGSAPLWSVMIDTAILSIVLCYVRERTGSIWTGVLIHGLKNSIAFVALFLV